MRILITTDVVGGVWSFTEELVDALAARGHQVALAALGGIPGAAQRGWVDERGDLRFFEIPCPLEWMPEPEPGLTRSLAALREVCDRFSPDVVHLNQFFYGAYEVGAPRVVTAHSDVLSWWHAVKGGDPPADGWFQRYAGWVRSGLAGSAARTAPTVWAARRTEELYAPGAVRPIHNARAPARHLAAVEGRRRRRVAAVGRLWDEGKSFTDLARAAPVLEARGVEVVVAGAARHPAGGPDFPAHAPGLRWAGALDAPAVQALLAETAVYAATSRYEPFGLAPLEAALAGCALVVSDIPTFRELWDGCALFYPAGDAAALADAVRVLTCTEGARRELAAAAQQRALERYSPARLGREYEAVYLEVTGS